MLPQIQILLQMALPSRNIEQGKSKLLSAKIQKPLMKTKKLNPIFAEKYVEPNLYPETISPDPVKSAKRVFAYGAYFSRTQAPPGIFWNRENSSHVSSKYDHIARVWRKIRDPWNGRRRNFAARENVGERLTAITLTKVVFPLNWRPTNVSSISSFQKSDLNQSRMRLINASILDPAYGNPAAS